MPPASCNFTTASGPMPGRDWWACRPIAAIFSGSGTSTATRCWLPSAGWAWRGRPIFAISAAIAAPTAGWSGGVTCSAPGSFHPSAMRMWRCWPAWTWTWCLIFAAWRSRRAISVACPASPAPGWSACPLFPAAIPAFSRRPAARTRDRGRCSTSCWKSTGTSPIPRPRPTVACSARSWPPKTPASWCIARRARIAPALPPRSCCWRWGCPGKW